MIAFGDPCYARAAYNLAISLKHFDRNIQICVLHDGKVFQRGYYDMSFFDKEVLLDETDLSNPAKVKVSIYNYLPYDYNLVLDVDALAFQNIQPLIDRCIASGKHYLTYLYNTYYSTDPDDMGYLLWAYRSKAWEHFDLKSDSFLPAPQSSIQFIEKCEASESLYKLILKNISNPIPLHELRYQWGGNQPDELYLAGSLAQLKIKDTHIGNDALFLANKTDMVRGDRVIAEQHFILCVFGGARFTKPAYRDLYDRLIIKKYTRPLGMNRCYKFDDITSGKHADAKNPMLVSTFNDNSNAKRGKLSPTTFPQFYPIKNTVKIDSTQLIQQYENPNRRTLNVSNWLNGSAIEYKGKKYFCYRMESKPFCVTTKLGLCLLDDNLQPIRSTNVLLNLHSDLRKYAKGFHVEDPRLFIFNDELYLSYCDGYQMGQAKINSETLQATESFYIYKPNKDRTEKNWTFFEYENELYSVYQIFPHTILKMNGQEWKTAHETRFPHEWKWGILRGGTSPVLVGEHYLSFFHSSLDMPTKERQYFIGAYMFENKPPFNVTHISKQPIIAGEKININIPRLDSRIYVVFPGGQIRTQNTWEVFFGNNDFEIRRLTVTDEMLLQNLVECNSEKPVEA